MLIEHNGKSPVVAPSAYVAPNAVVSGDVTVGPDARILFGAVITADGGPVHIGACTVVMEQALVRGRQDHPARVGDHVLVGPHAHVNGATVEDEVFLATGTSVFPGARIGRGAEVRVNAVVHVNSSLDPGTVVPIGWIAAGAPAQLFAPARHEELWAAQQKLDFPSTVFGLPRGQDTLDRVTRGYAELFGTHRDDRLLGAHRDDPARDPG
jgi:carbonic anhydrase/acetyltransferase-like protein (isoleucine patch superfamily)